MIFNIENDTLSISINTFGAELNSIKGKKDNIEFLWNGNEEFWKFHSPVLFPIVGKVTDGEYLVDEKKYKLPQHGLARHKYFNIVEENENSITFELTYSENTLKVYPYKFSLQIKYTLINNSLTVKYIVKNLDNKPITFSLGGHPAFMCPILPNEKFEDYYFELEKEETAPIMQITDKGYFLKDCKPYLNNNNIIKFGKKCFEPDTLVFKNLNSSFIRLKSKNHDKYVELNFSKFPYLGLWTKATGAPFVCIEPWFGHADFVDFKGEFKDKAGVINLVENKSFECEYIITIYQ